MTNFANDAFFMATIRVLFLLGFYEMARHVVMLGSDDPFSKRRRPDRRQDHKRFRRVPFETGCLSHGPDNLRNCASKEWLKT